MKSTYLFQLSFFRVFVIGVLLITAQNRLVAQHLADSVEKVDWIQKHAIAVTSIDPADTNFQDLASLKEKIGDARVVLLGEQTHGDGSTFLAKVRLIKFLHQQMGFDVLAFESEWYSLLHLDDSLASLSEMALKEGNILESNLYQIWSLSKQVQPLFTYIRQSKVSTSPLTLSGFDCSHPQQIAQKQLIADLDTFLSSLHYPTHQDRHRQFNTILKGLMLWEYNNKSSQGEQDLFFQELQSMETFISGYRKGTHVAGLEDKVSFYQQVVTSLKGFAQHAWSVRFQDGRAQLMDKYGNKDGKVRDAFMASNALWLIKEKFKNRKLILWGATYHFARNLSQTDSIKMGINYEKVRTMADILYQQLPGELYSIGFTTYQGEHGMPWLSSKKLSLPSKGSMEELIHAAHVGDCIIDFKNLPQHAWLQEELSMRPLGYKAMTTQWPRVLDAIFFIDKMIPSTAKD